MNHESGTQYLSEKKRKRLESKKKKAEAFLALVGHNKDSDSTSTTTQLSLRGSTDTSLMSTSFSPKMAEYLISGAHSSASDGGEHSRMGNTSKAEGEGTKSSDPVEEMKAIIRARKKAMMQKPKVFLSVEDMVPFRAMPNNPIEEDEIPPLYVMDLQQLLLYGVQHNKASYKPRWCKVLRVGKIFSVVLLMVDNISYDDFLEHKDQFPNLTSRFESIAEMVCPLQYGHSVEEELFNVPLSVSQLKKANVKVPDNIQRSVVEKIGRPVGNPSFENFSRKCLLLSTYQMMQEGYPMPVKTKGCKYRGFVFTKDKYEEVTEKSPLFAVDCEMCYTVIGRNELTRVSIMTEDGEVIYDELVKPKNRITNYLTRFSGITKELLDPVTKTLEEVQQDIKNLLPADAILCGQSLNSDLMALKVFHPYVIDTSVIFNMSGNRRVKAGLRKLTQFFLGRTIQASAEGHCSTEDAGATLDLVKLKLSKGLEFGDATLSGVYFPDIRTYFMGPEGGGKQVSENVEHNSSELSTSGLGQNGRQLADLKSQPPSDSNKTSSSNSDKSSESSMPGNQARLPPNQSSSSSSSSESETETSHSSSKRKRKNGENAFSSEHSTAKKAKGEGKDDKNCDFNNHTPQADNAKTLTGPATSVISTVNFVKAQQEHLFNQDNSVLIPHSFFQLVKEAGRTACVIDQPKFMPKYQSQQVDKLEVNTDSDVRHKSKECVQNKEFVMAQWREFPVDVNISVQERQRLMRKVDRRLHSVLRKVPPNALVVVVLKGRIAENSAHNMAVFLNTT